MNKKMGAAYIANIIILACGWSLLYYGMEFSAGLCLGVAASNLLWLVNITD